MATTSTGAAGDDGHTPQVHPPRLEEVVLEGALVRLEPMRADHIPALTDAGLFPELWQWVPTPVRTHADMTRYVDTAISERVRGEGLPFTIVWKDTNTVIGSTRFQNIRLLHRGVEIGWTWYSPPYQRTGANTETKLLLLRHAFETLALMRVELKTDILNARSRAAIERLGAQQEGVFRKHMISGPQSRIRDTVYYSITDDEWPSVRDRLEGKLRAHAQAVRSGSSA